jgi:S-adenosylhomocysteine hydrolase
VFYKTGGYRYVEKDAIIEHLRWMGFTVCPAEDITPDHIVAMHRQSIELGKKTFIVEDGGKSGPILASNPEFTDQVAFIIEQTSRGERLTAGAKPKIRVPVLSIAHAKGKKPEAAYVADGGVSALKALMPHDSIKTMKPAVTGLSDIGRAVMVMMTLAENCAPAIGFDLDPAKRRDALPLCGHIAHFAIDAVRDVIFGCTGDCSIGADLIPHLKSGVKLIPMSSEDIEFDKAALARMGTPSPIFRAGRAQTEANRLGTRYTMHGTGKHIELIADGYPINFFAADFGGMGDRQADMTMSLLFVSMLAAASGKYARRRGGLIVGEVDRLDTEHRLAERFLRYHA